MRPPFSRTLPFALALALSACGGDKGPRRGPETVPVTVATAEKTSVPLEVAAIGHVEAINAVSVRPRVGGEIVKVAFREGQDVSAGDLLFAIDPRPYQSALAGAQAALERDRAKAQNARADVARFTDLVKKDYVTKEQYDAALAGAASADAVVKADEAAVQNATLDLGFCAVTAPIGGRTGSLLVKSGNIVKANDDRSMVLIQQMDPIYVSFSVAQQSVPGAVGGLAARNLKVKATPTGGTPREGVLTFVDNAVDPATGTILMKGTFANRDGGLWPGQFFDVVLTLGAQADAIVVPDEAIQSGQQGTYVFVVKDDMSAESRPVTTVRSQGGRTVVSKGLARGERVVTDGQLRLASGTKVEIKEPVGSPAKSPEPAR
jgi:multidrug efflux system membrane fusion protein